MTSLSTPRLTDERISTVSTAIHPIVPGFHPDPTVCRVGEEYFLANSSFEYSPGVPIRRSRDLLHWELIGNALEREDQFRAGHSDASKGVYAPTLRHRDGLFHLITTDVSGSGGQLLVTATDAAGPWSSPMILRGLQGIDPDLAWDEQGRCYVTYCSTAPGLRGIAQARVDLGAGELVSEPRVIWTGTGLAFPEAPHLYEVDGWWYLVIAEGGTERGHSATVARARTPEGPFTAAPDGPLLTHRSTSHPVQNVGHADLVEMVDGGWAAVYLGVRPRGITPMFHVNGRETFLAGIDWIDGWPVADEDRFHRPLPVTSYTDDFSGILHARWISPGAALSSMVVPLPGRGVELLPGHSSSGTVSAITARIEDHDWSFAATIDRSGGDAGLLVRLDDRHWCELQVVGGVVSAIAQVGSVKAVIGEPVPIDESTLLLRAASSAPRWGGPDDIVLSALVGGIEVCRARVDGRYLSTEVAGGFTGRVIGIRPIEGSVVLERVEYTGHDSAGEADPAHTLHEGS